MKFLDGQKYYNGAGGFYELPRCEWLLKWVKQVEANLIEWYKQNKYKQGDGYYCRITNKGKWEVYHTNDYPMQHGSGSSHIFNEQEFLDAMKLNAKIF